MDKRIEEIEARLKAATPGPWSSIDYLEVDESGFKYYPVVAPNLTIRAYGNNIHHDAELIAHAPTDMRELLAYIDAQAKKLAAAQEALNMARKVAEDDGLLLDTIIIGTDRSRTCWVDLPAVIEAKEAGE